MEADLPLMMEKPPAPRTEQAWDLVELAVAKGRIAQAGHSVRQHLLYGFACNHSLTVEARE